MKRGLTVVFWIDAIIAVAFGIYSWMCPLETFGTILEIPEEHANEFLSLFAVLSLFYVLIGMVCIICARSNFQVHFWIGLVMLIRHLIEGLLKWKDIGEDWLTGNPYPDLVIHTLFTVAYAITLYFAYKKRVLWKP
ncbi:hypothetical protein [Fluviicola sp.]|uniref:hypothetical protein n=1 Tax=Fluviicola sp. TaxID=1917219 RepID=UPI0031D34FD5